LTRIAGTSYAEIQTREVRPGRETAPGFLLREVCRGVKLLEPRRSCMAPPSSQRKSIVSVLYFQWRGAEWPPGAMRFLIGRLRHAKLPGKPPLFFSCSLQE
jgi:hypothetical protein